MAAVRAGRTARALALAPSPGAFTPMVAGGAGGAVAESDSWLPALHTNAELGRIAIDVVRD